jgi:hypothetical protein
MYIVGSRVDQAVLAVEKIEDRPDHDVDRSLALKVGASLEVVTRLEQAAPSEDGALAGALVSPPAPSATSSVAPEHPAAGARPAWAVFLDLGGGLSSNPKPYGLVGGTIGLSRERPTWRVDFGLGFELGTRYESARGASEVRAWQRGPLLTVRALRRRGRFEWGGELVLMCALLSAEGIAADGTRGEETLLLPSLGLGADLRVRLFASAFLRLSPRLEVPFVHQTLAVDRATVVDFSPVGVTVPLSLLFYLPFAAGGN